MHVRLRLGPPCLAVSVLLGAALHAHSALSEPLALTRLRLYETGVGYFERTGTLEKNQAVLPVPASHLDDALKTLVVHAPDGEARVTAVEFSSSVSLGRARSLAGLGGDGETLTLLALLKSLRGSDVALGTPGGRHEGRVVEVLAAAESDLELCEESDREKSEPCTPRRRPTLVFLTTKGEIRRLRIDELVFVRPKGGQFRARFAPVLEGLGGRAASLRKELAVHAVGRRPVTLGYVSETPVWRASYRLVLGDAGAPALVQGWALIHNDTDEAWRRVRVELVNGRPDSFLFPLAAPRYSRRPLVTPAEPLSTLPQLADTTADALYGEELGESFGAGGLGLSGIGEGGGGRGEGIGLGNVGTIGFGRLGGGPSESPLLDVGNLAALGQSEGVESGALFRFALAEPVDLGAHASLLAPFLSEPIDAARIALFEAPGAVARSAVRLSYRGAQTLPAGTVAVFADGGFAGESALDRMKPRETALVEFGADLDVTLAVSAHDTSEETKLVAFSGGRLVEHYLRRHRLRYRLENRSATERSAFLKMEFVNNAKISGAAELIYDEKRGRALAGFAAPPSAVVTPQLAVEEGLSREHDPNRLGSVGLTRLARSPSLGAALRKLLTEAAGHYLVAERSASASASASRELGDLRAEIDRLRGHASAARGEAAKPIVARLLEREDATLVLGGRIKSLDAETRRRTRLAQAALGRL